MALSMWTSEHRIPQPDIYVRSNADIVQIAQCNYHSWRSNAEITEFVFSQAKVYRSVQKPDLERRKDEELEHGWGYAL